jgi:hypothetical protein
MLTHPILTGRSLIFGLALGISAVGGLSCTAEDPDSSVQEDVRNVLVTADTLSSLEPGEFLDLDLIDQNVVYHLDYSDAPIDYARILLVLDEKSDLLPLEDTMRTIEMRDYDGNPAPDLLAAADERFRVSADPANFKVLNDAELNDLEENGYYIKQSSASPGPAPQNADDCIHAECVICDPPWNVQPSGPRVCVHIQHVWCGPP